MWENGQTSIPFPRNRSIRCFWRKRRRDIGWCGSKAEILFLFGRGGEELELLTEHGIPYEIVPGVTSPLAVPAYNGIPVTHRDFCSSLHIITGHRRAGKEYDINFRALVDTRVRLYF